MRFLNFSTATALHEVQAGVLLDGRVIPLAAALGGRPAFAVSRDTIAALPEWQAAVAALDPARVAALPSHDPAEVALRPPVHPAASFRDFYAFEAHVRSARARRGLAMIPEWYAFPVFYFSNANAFLGHDAPLAPPPDAEWLDYELEVAAVIGRGGRDIAGADAERHIAGYTILNDWSARRIQREELKVGLGPAKGKDFATSLGPWLVTPDELRDARAGKGYALRMTARRNGRVLSEGTWADIHWSFGELVERASRGVELQPGDVIGSGTVGTGCILELGPDDAGGWLAPGDVVELEIERLGVLRNRVA
jgi:fumarylacetoacetate (FAA) hydrolase